MLKSLACSCSSIITSSMSSILTGPRTGDVRSGVDDDDDVMRSTVASVIVTGDERLLMIRSPPNVVVVVGVVIVSGSTRLAAGFSRSMLWCLTRCWRMETMSAATCEQSRQIFLSASFDVWPMCSFWKCAFIAMCRWNLLKGKRSLQSCPV